MGYKPTARFDLSLISVGNLAVGGTGKTPMVEHLIRLLKSNYKIATLSRGYGRHTKGFRVASATDNASTLGDEPFQFFKKFGREINVVVGEERAMAIPYLVDLHPQTEVILLDDAFQHRKVKPSFQILLSDYNNPFYRDFLLPAGKLRESRVGAERADVVVVTKCPLELGEAEMIDIEADIRKYTNKPVFFTTVRYGNVIPFGNKAAGFPDKVVLVTGIANAKPLTLFIASNFQMVRHFGFSDHYRYTKKDMETISSFAKEHEAAVITTEKDFVKMDSEEFQPFLSDTPFFYLPIEVEFLKNGKDFDEMVLNAVKNA
jgi:tetraacyldisaccharide 4'-kinase